ncbi:MAG: hypothetical protein JWR19_3728 [Pedosphaera sp.]|nr:hypothetical protein [Pedosphaera sp.]
MKLMLFLGSGVSKPSGLPCVGEITDALLNDPWVRHTNGVFYPANGVTAGLKEITPTLQRFLKLLKSYADGYSALRNGQESNYEDLFYLARQLADDSRGTIYNPAILGFVNEVRARTEALVDQLGDLGTEDRFLGMAWRAEELIECVVRHKLFNVKEIKGLELIVALALESTVTQLDIFTLNHDLLVERLLREKGIHFTDGFGPQNGEIRHFEPATFKASGKVRLFKLHGSIDWFRFRTGTGTDEKTFVAKPDSGNPSYCKDQDGKRISNLDEIPTFLAGTYNKLTAYGFSIFGEMQFWFHKILKEHDVMAMSGYGWNDLGINGRLFEWLLQSRRQRLYLMHEKPEILRTHSKSAMWHAYDRLIEEKRLVPIKKWMENTSLEELLAAIKFLDR